ncbi:Lacal_2735 family protein [Psychroserpens ponticola]|uniref:Lacal_2735 family protein n=1 Tax=Psychroserpens ponticola TaxID=2932268 RepID=A0ABY7RTW3_9FLAO|nr:Lacal_2735 family protein [Psychroserpens ponticola]WCO00547.1 Lacal_2735 family protein [Psychroserpens ponticola]
MFGLFKTSSEADKLQKKYKKLMKEWHTLSTTNRSESDKKYAEAEKIQEQIKHLQN